MNAKEARAIVDAAKTQKRETNVADWKAALSIVYKDIEKAANAQKTTLEYRWNAWGTGRLKDPAIETIFPSLKGVTLFYSGVDGRDYPKRGDYPAGDYISDTLKADGYRVSLSDGSLTVSW